MNRCSQLLQTYITEYIIRLYTEGEVFEYYWLNTRYPQCVIDDMSDYEIAYKFPLSGERFILDCWAIVIENSEFSKDNWSKFVIFIDEYIKECLCEINSRSIVNESKRH